MALSGQEKVHILKYMYKHHKAIDATSLRYFVIIIIAVDVPLIHSSIYL